MVYGIPAGRFVAALVLGGAGLWLVSCGVNACWLRWGKRGKPGPPRSLLLLAAALALSSACRPERPSPSWSAARLVAALGSPDADVRRRAAVRLGERASPEALWPLARALGDERWEVRVAAVESLERLDDPRADRAILAAARDGHWWVRTRALNALRRRKPEGSEAAARLALGSDNDAVRAAGERLLAARAEGRPLDLGRLRRERRRGRSSS